MDSKVPEKFADAQAKINSGYARDAVLSAQNGNATTVRVPIQKQVSPISGKARFAYVCAGLFLNVLSAFVAWFDSQDRSDAYAREALKMAFIGSCINTLGLVVMFVMFYIQGVLL